MKKIYLFFIFLFIIGCGYNSTSKKERIAILCPTILFGSGHKIYIDSQDQDISLDNIEYQGIFNNVIFSKECIIENNIFSSELSILFILEKFNNEINIFEMPFYLAILDQNNELKDMLYFSVNGELKNYFKIKNITEADVAKKITLNNKNIDENSTLVIGFMLDKKKKEILN